MRISFTVAFIRPDQETAGLHDQRPISTGYPTAEQLLQRQSRGPQGVVQQQAKANAGQTVGMLDGKGRHLLSNALVSLYFEMKDFYAAIGRGLVTEAGEVILPASGEVTDVTDKGVAVVENFLNKEPQTV